MGKLLGTAGIIVGLLGTACNSSAPTGGFSADAPRGHAEHFDASWSESPLWDDGQAEVAIYEARRPQYGKIETYEAVFIVVKEEFDSRLFVKANPPLDGRRLTQVMKLNVQHSYWTDRYPYNYLLSVFVARQDPSHLIKLTLGGQEWCGNTFKEVRNWGSRPELIFHSYWDREADGVRPLDLGRGDLLEDQLPLALRSLKGEPGLEIEARILPSLISNRVSESSEFVPVTIRILGEESLETPAGSFAARKIAVQFAGTQQTWWFEKASPGMMLRMESSDRSSWRLKDRTRKPYWRVATFHPQMGAPPPAPGFAPDTGSQEE